MNTEVIRSRIEPGLKKEAEKVLKQMGLTSSDAIRLFLRYVASERELPFPVRVPNAKTVIAIQAVERGEVRPYKIPK
jgi:DNA-damage-inducible protein J